MQWKHIVNNLTVQAPLLKGTVKLPRNQNGQLRSG
jgi:hypothetical protein